VFNQNSSTDIKVAVLEEKLNIYEQMMTKIENAIDAISETNKNISKMLAIHDERLEQAVRSDEVIIKMLEDIKKNVEAEDTDLSNRIDETNVKLEEVRKIKWMTVGVGIVVAAGIGAISTLASGIFTPSEMDHRMEPHYFQSPELQK
jgi:uncharacterized protein YukE